MRDKMFRGHQVPGNSGARVQLLWRAFFWSLLCIRFAHCEPSQQQQELTSQLQQQRSQALSNELSQDAYSLFPASDAGGFSNNYVHGAYVNAKRARKMSAFVPMRGRKDGRDQPPAASLEEPGLMRELEASNELALRRLLAAPAEPLGPQADQLVPRQFMEQLQLMARKLASLQRRQRGAGTAWHSAELPNQSESDSRPGAQQLLAVGPLELAPMMEAKFRRAFHPMRGKRAGLELADELEELV